MSRVTSAYFDSPDLDAYWASYDGEFEKRKVRIRWYDYPPLDHEVPIFIELKAKEGFKSRKLRKKMFFGGAALREGSPAQIVNADELLQTLWEFGYAPVKQLRPVIMIAYNRWRFRDPASGISMTYDTDVVSSMLNHGALTWRGCLTLQAGVLETKGQEMTLPKSLQHVKDLYPVWSGFSKYVRCIESHLERPGTYGWLRP